MFAAMYYSFRLGDGGEYYNVFTFLKRCGIEKEIFY